MTSRPSVRLRPRAPLVLGTLLAVTACSSAEAPAAAPAPTTLSPLLEFQAALQPDEEQQALDRRRIEEEIADCMAGEGFDYLPIDHEAIAAQDPFAQAYESFGTREFAEKHGFGISLRAPLLTMDDTFPHDPNLPLVNALSDTERQAYTEALHGTIQVPGSGCTEHARDVVHGDREPIDESVAEEIWAEHARRTAALSELPEVRAAAAVYVDCMADLGHVADPDPNVLRRALRQEWDDLHGMTPTTFGSGVTEHPRRPGPDEVSAFTAKERRTALDEFDCRLPYDEVYVAALHDMERTFIAEFSEQLEQITPVW